MKAIRFAPLLLAAVALAPTEATAGDGDDVPTVAAAYVALRDQGCDVSTIGSPIVARVFRNVPYAQQGKIFKAAELTYLFEHDGGWYQPSAANADVATAADRACVRKLDAQDKKLRTRAKLKKPIEQAITRHPGAILDMARLVEPDFKKFGQSDRVVDGLRVWTLSFDPGGLILIRCTVPAADAKAKPPSWANLECGALAAG